MNEEQALKKMIAPGARKPGKYREGVIQIHVTRACDKACFNCTQGSNLGGKYYFITPENFERALKSLQGWWGVVGVFGGNPAMHPQFDVLCNLLKKYFPKEQRGLWCNHPRGKARIMRDTFDPKVSNLNVHMDREAYAEFKRDWPEAQLVGRDTDSRHSPPWVAMKDVMPAEERRWEIISECDINHHWSAMLGQFRGELRAWFCEIAGAQSIVHQDDSDYPDTGIRLNEQGLMQGVYDTYRWWELGIHWFADQVRKHCHDCGIPLRGYGELAVSNSDGVEQVSKTHEAVYKPKRVGRKVELVVVSEQVKINALPRMTDYLGNAGR